MSATACASRRWAAAAARWPRESIAAGIADRDRTSGTNLLPSVNPTFNWVRLAQRIPVRVKLDDVPPGVELVTGADGYCGYRGEGQGLRPWTPLGP